jgi:nucleoside phosphorylase
LTTFRPEIAILTAIDCEYIAVQRLLSRYSSSLEEDNNHNKHGLIPGANGYHHVVLIPQHYGQALTAVHGTLILQKFPSIHHLIFVGIAGGRPRADRKQPLRIGDVIVSDAVVDLESARINTNGKVEQRGLSKEASKDLTYASSTLIADIKAGRKLDEWKNRIKQNLENTPETMRHDLHALFSEKRPPIPLLGHIGSSSKKVESRTIRNRWAKASGYRIRAFEMEGFGIATAAEECGKKFFVIRGLSDMADGKEYDNVSYVNVLQSYAACVASAFLEAVLARIEVRPATEDKSYIGLSTQFEEALTNTKRIHSSAQHEIYAVLASEVTNTNDKNIPLLFDYLNETVHDADTDERQVYIERIIDPKKMNLDFLLRHIKMVWSSLRPESNLKTKYKILFSRLGVGDTGAVMIDRDFNREASIFFYPAAHRCFFQIESRRDEIVNTAYALYDQTKENARNANGLVPFPAKEFSQKFDEAKVREWLKNLYQSLGVEQPAQ